MKMKDKQFFFFLFLVFVLSAFSITSVFANLIPTTSPCWVQGTVSSDDLNVSGLTIRAFRGSTGLESAVIQNDGTYSINSIGANDGDTIDLRVYGATFETFTFQGFCKTGEDPWVEIDVEVQKVANGQACSNNAICTSGNCVSNICAAPSTGGGSSGGGSSGGGGSFSPSGTTSSGSGTQVVSGSPFSNTTAVRQVGNSSTIQVRASELFNTTFVPLELIDLIVDAPETLITVEVTLKEATLANGEKRLFTEIRKLVSVQVDGSDYYTIIEIIPKEVVETASLISGNFTVLEDDPIIEFKIPSSQIVNGFAQITYTILEDVKSKVSSIETVVVYDDQTQTQSTITIPQPTTQEPVAQESGFRFNWLWIIVIAVLLIVIVALLMRK
jgi:hypothetical protein